MKTMITGATGFIGSKLLRSLTQSGCEINALCRQSSDVSEIRGEGVNIFYGDITDTQSIKECMKGCGEVYHLAALAKNWSKENSQFYNNNTLASKKIFQSALECGVRRVLFMSSAITIGSGKDPVDETFNRTMPPFTPYESSKIEAEMLTSEFSREGLDVITVNPTRVFGPGLINRGNYGSKMIKMYMDGKFRLIPGNGESMGNYVFIEDLVNGCIGAMKKGKSSEKYILGGENLSYNEFFRIVTAVSGISRIVFHLPLSIAVAFSSIELLRAHLTGHNPFITPGWVRTFSADWAFSSQKAVEDFDYRITPFKEALLETINWINSTDREGVTL